MRTTTMAAIRCALAAATLAAAILFAAAGASAQAREPWWNATVASVPASKAGGYSQVVVEVQNLGDAMAKLYENPVQIVDKLPEGVTPTIVSTAKAGSGYPETAVHPESQLGEQNPFGGPPALRTALEETCNAAGQTVTCSDNGILHADDGFFVLKGFTWLPYERAIIVIEVKVAPGAGKGMNELSVTGGGAPPVNVKRPLQLESPGPYGVEQYTLDPEEEGGRPDTQAGSHPFQLTTTLLFNTHAVPVHADTIEESGIVPEELPLALTKDLRFNLPPGLIGNPTPLPKCSTYDFEVGNESEGPGPHNPTCPANTVVGVAAPIITAPEFIGNPWTGFTFSSPLYNLEPAVGEPARFGFKVPLINEPVILDTSVRAGGDYGVTVTVPNITSLFGFLGNIVTFWGVPGDPRHDSARGGQCLEQTSFNYKNIEYNGATEKVEAELDFAEPSCKVAEQARPLMIEPTTCTAPPHTTIETDSWSDIGKYTEPFSYSFQDSNGAPFHLDGCNRLGFEPAVKVTPDGQQAATPTGLLVDVHVPQTGSLNPEGLAESTVKDSRVTLPAGVALNAAGGDGLAACSTSAVGMESPEEQECPESSKIATVELHTPLLPEPIVGAAYLAQQNANPFGSLLAMYLVVHDPISGVRVKIAGEVKADPVTGQLTSYFNNTPPLPFEDLEIHFFGGSRAPLATPALCGAYRTSASIAPWSGDSAVNSESEFLINSGPNHGACQNPPPFAPSLTAGSPNVQSAEFTPFTMTMSREDGSQNLDAIKIHLPKGLYGLLAGVELCPEPQADEGLCGANSKIGETTISVGVGGNPFTVFGGKVYLTGPYKGAPFGLSIVNPAKAGPFDVEHDTSKAEQYMPACDCVVVRAKIEVDPITAALTVTTDTTGPHRIPTILDGIPLEIKHVNVTIDRERFMFNPSNCEPQPITGLLTSAEGATEELSVPFQVTNCARLSFPPSFKVTTTGKTSRTSGASLDAKLTYPKNVPFDKETNIAKVKVELPKELPSRLTTLQKACPDTVFNANPENCPAQSKIGEAVATTPIIPEPFSGPAYFVSHGGAKFPELIVVLHGYSLTVELHGETFISPQGVTSTTFSTVPDVAIGSFELKLPQGPYSALGANVNLCKFKEKHKLVMPTTFIAQNGSRIEERTPIAITGCHRATKARHHAKRHRAKHHRGHRRGKKGK